MGVDILLIPVTAVEDTTMIDALAIIEIIIGQILGKAEELLITSLDDQILDLLPIIIQSITLIIEIIRIRQEIDRIMITETYNQAVKIINRTNLVDF